MEASISQLFIEDIKYRMLDESIPRIEKCIAMLTDDQLNYSFNDNTNSISNLILHLEGNITQWLLNTCCDANFKRNRPEEFVPNQNKSKADLTVILCSLSTKISICLDQIKSETLAKKYTVQNFDTNGVAILIHVTEHLSYHTGQIALITKILMNVATEFYDDLALDVEK